MFDFKVVHKDKHSCARAGELHAPHGIVHTPAFVPVGTQATVKSLTPKDLGEIGVEMLFGNTYHLHLRPGEDIIASLGGLGKFMAYKGVTMTDSGGFQVFSLAKKKTRGSGNFSVSLIRDDSLVEDREANLVKISEEGVEFRSHLDGSKHLFTPEQSIEIQKKLGADIVLVFDQCTSYPVTHESAKKDMERTHRWALRSLEAFVNGMEQGGRKQAIYGIVQGSIFKDLREASARFIASHNFDGIAIGGVSVGESKVDMQHVVDWTVPLLPDEKVRHMLGVGDVDDIFAIIERGIDTFDCVTPSRLGRVGHVFVPPPEGDIKNRFRLDITKSVFANNQQPLSSDCSCFTCQHFTRGYINHLFRAKELLGYRLATYHNVFFITNLVRIIRESLFTGHFHIVKDAWLGI